jgi:hypothetical protein
VTAPRLDDLGVVGRTADDTTTTSAPPTWNAAWPIATDTPSVSSRVVTADASRRSR